MDFIRIGNIELHPAERALRADGRPIEIGARAFDLLSVLAETPGRLVTKATLLERVWPKLVVDENNLAAQIANLRRVLGAGAIRTVPGFGYRLEAPVTSANSASIDTAAQNQAPAQRKPALDLAVPRRAWPDRLTPIIGREADLRRLQELLARSSLVTIVGGAGVGKTRLAQEVLIISAEEQSAACAWASLESVDAVEHAPSAIALALGLSFPDGVDGFTALQQALEQSPALLILDGAEHLVEELAMPLAALIARTRALRVLITSQAPLGVTHEAVYRLAPLSTPETDAPHDEIVAHPAVELFSRRAQSADQRFDVNARNSSFVAAICRRLDGNPLAIELAAARVPALGVATLLQHLDDRFRLLKAGNGDARHSALQAAFAWSYGLLAPDEQAVFNRLGAFAGSFSLDAAARCAADDHLDAIAAIDLIGRLVDRSLVVTLPVDPPRYRLLETARFFALDKLRAADQLDHAKNQMAAAILHLLDAAYVEYWSLDEAIWLQRYGAEIDNVRAAIDWAAQSDHALGVALYGASWPLFVEMELFTEARALFDRTVRMITDALPPPRIARFWEAVATYETNRQYDRARYAAELAEHIYAEIGDHRAQYYAAMLLAHNWRGDDEAARAAFTAARRLEDAAWPARLLMHGALTEGVLLMSAGEFNAARSAYQQAVRLALTVSERQALAAVVNIVELDLTCGDIAGALQLGRPLAQTLRHSTRHATRSDLLTALFAALLLANEVDEARSVAFELYELAARLDLGKLYAALDAMAFLTCMDRRYDAAAQILHSADHAHQARGEAQRRPAEERMRSQVLAWLDESIGDAWRTNAAPPLTELQACALALDLHI